MNIENLSIDDIEWKIECLPEYLEIEGNALASGDDELDRETEQYIQEQLNNGNQWAWCCVKVTGWFDGLNASDYLGSCSYQDQDQFEKDGYFRDMQTRVLEDIKTQLAALLSRLGQLPALHGASR